MKKILLLTDAMKLNEKTLDFACYIARLGKTKLVGVFIDDAAKDSAPSLKSLGGQMYVEEITMSEEELLTRENNLKKNINLFKDGCMQRAVVGIAHRDSTHTMKQLTIESRYADLMILDPTLSFSSEDNEIPTDFVTELLKHTECPVLVAPENFEEVDELVFAYEDSKSSAFAIRQFCSQLPELAGKKITVLHINDQGAEDTLIGKNPEFYEWLAMHFSDTHFVELAGDPREELLKYFLECRENNNKILIAGALGRNLFSEFFKPSTTSLVLRAVDMPMFIAHQ